VPSARRAAAALLGAALAAALGGCYTTQEKNVRAKIAADRILSIRKPVRVGARDPAVTVEAKALIRSSSGTAVVVRVRNTGGRPVSDLPVSVAVRHGGAVFRLNGRRNLGYFRTHVPAVPPKGATTWVFTTKRSVPRGSLLVRVGRQVESDANRASSLPQITVDEPSGRGRVRSVVKNSSDIPQPGLNVYGYAIEHGRYVAAGRAVIPDLAAHDTAKFELQLYGAGGGRPVRLEAPATALR
jgi:hypothetical protein